MGLHVKQHNSERHAALELINSYLRDGNKKDVITKIRRGCPLNELHRGGWCGDHCEFFLHGDGWCYWYYLACLGPACAAAKMSDAEIHLSMIELKVLLETEET